jgi:hypothetical protein
LASQINQLTLTHFLFFLFYFLYLGCSVTFSFVGGDVRGSVSRAFALNALPHAASKRVWFKISFDEGMAPPTFCF